LLPSEIGAVNVPKNFDFERGDLAELTRPQGEPWRRIDILERYDDGCVIRYDEGVTLAAFCFEVDCVALAEAPNGWVLKKGVWGYVS
jgi:hypothetical protein